MGGTFDLRNNLNNINNKNTKNNYIIIKSYEQKLSKAIETFQLQNTGALKTSYKMPLPQNLEESISHNWNSFSWTSFINESSAGRGAAHLGYNVDPNYSQVYLGTQPRSFTFDFVFIPMSRSESAQILAGLINLKRETSPKIGSLMQEQPHLFSIAFKNENLNSLMKIGTFSIADIRISYNANGYYDVYEDGMPKQINVSITLTEIAAMTYEKW